MPQFPPTGWDLYGLSASDTSVFLAAVLVMVLIVVFVSRYGTAFACGFWAFLGTTWFCLNLEFVLQRTSLAEPRVPLDVGLRLTALFAIGVGFVKTLRINSKLRADGGMAAVVGTFAALLLFGIPLLLSPQGSYAYPASRRTQCRNNLKQIGLALHNYHDHWNTFPQAAISKPPVSWRVNILPFADHSDLYKQYDDSFAWDSQVNLPLSFERIRALQCPSRPKRTETNQQEQWFTSYTAPLGPGSVLGSLRSVRIRDIADGTSSTILVVESCGTAIVWSEPRDSDLSRVDFSVNKPAGRIDHSGSLLSSYHRGIAQVVLADGSVRSISEGTDPGILKALVTRTGGEDLGEW